MSANIQNVASKENAMLDIEVGLSLLGTLAQLLDDAAANDMTGPQISAAAALCQKAGGLLERGLLDANVINGPGLIGTPEQWISRGLRRYEVDGEGDAS